MKRRLIALVLAAAMVFSLAACAGGGKGGKTKIDMWCIATETDSNRKAYEKAIAEVTAAHPEIEFNWEAIENQSYKTKIKAAVAADEMPDIFFTWSCAFLGDFVNANRVYCLDEEYKNWAKDLDPKMLNNTTFNGKHYGVPTTMNIVVMFANMDILKKVGYTEVPGTYEELIKCCDKLLAAGYTPFGCSGKEDWCVTEYVEPIIEKTAGAKAWSDIMTGAASWDNKDVAKAIDIFQEMISKKYFDPNGAALTNNEVKANFQQGKYAFYMNGSWNCADFFADSAFFPKVKVSEFPVIDSSKSKLGQLIGGPSDTLAVAQSSKNADKAAAFAFELGKAICHYGYLDGCGLPAWTPDYDTSSVNALTATVADIVAKSDAMVLFGDTIQAADIANIYLSYVAKVYGKQIDGNGFISGLKKDIK
ncbi:MAG: extracellular solute-binding protein [Lachnospiraceae bacterium]|nr:extracellular solute-binding protein [Lachnospiraceae bacterium]